MSFKVNENEMDSTFRVPTSIVDNHIRVANLHQMKVLLWLLRNSKEPDIDRMCAELKMKKDDAEDYIQYWVLVGVLEEEKSRPAKGEKQASKLKVTEAFTAQGEPEPAEHTSPSAAAFPAAQDIPRSKPTAVEISARIEESPEIALLFREAQKKMSKIIGYEMQSVLLMMHDYDGLPVEVIFMLIEYCVSIGKTHSSYIAAVGKNWGDCEIDSIEKADERISSLRTADSVWSEFAALAGITNPRPTTSQATYISKWVTELGFTSSMIYLAYEEMADHTQRMSFPYMDKVLTGWYENGIKTAEQLSACKKAAADAKKARSEAGNTESSAKNQPASASGKASYDLGAYEQSALKTTLKYERKGKK